MTIGERIKILRKEKGWSQDLFGQLVGLHGRHIGKYETNKAKPSTKALNKIAEVFGITIDELVRGDEKPTLDVLIRDRELLKLFQEVEELEEKDRTVAKSLLNALVVRKQCQQLLEQHK